MLVTVRSTDAGVGGADADAVSVYIECDTEAAAAAARASFAAKKMGGVAVGVASVAEDEWALLAGAAQ